MAYNIYPPILESSQPAFIYNDTIQSYLIYFSLPSTMSLSSVKHIQIKVTQQSNNKSIVEPFAYPDGIIYKDISEISTVGNQYAIAIIKSDLRTDSTTAPEGWLPGCLYKIQLRFGANEISTWYPNNLSNFTTWKNTQVSTDAFSEWSNIMVIKAISKPTVKINNSSSTEASILPTFYGSYKIEESEQESVSKYKFDIYSGALTAPSYNALFSSSGWIAYNTYEAVTSYRFNKALTNGSTYTVFYSIETVNGYKGVSAGHSFTVNTSSSSTTVPGVLEVDSTSIAAKEGGYIGVYLTSSSSANPLNGKYVVIRRQNGTQIWEDLKYLNYNNEVLTKTLVLKDFLIESGIKYEYAIVSEDRDGLRGALLYEDAEASARLHELNLQYTYLYAKGSQLKLKFNNNMASFKKSVLASKTDTLGSKYPILTRNGYAYYAEFPVNGLISILTDEEQNFITLKEDGGYYQNQLVIPADKFETISTDYIDSVRSGTNTSTTFSTKITDNNIFIERVFREKVESFLNDGDYKLYKSATEGNFIIGLMNVSLTPNTTLGRMIWEFSATAYELAEYNLDNLIELGIYNTELSAIDTDHELLIYTSQLSYESCATTVDLYAAIKAACNAAVGSEGQYHFDALDRFWLDDDNDFDSINMNITGATNPVTIMQDRTYVLSNLTTTSSPSIKLQQASPLKLNYTCSVYVE